MQHISIDMCLDNLVKVCFGSTPNAGDFFELSLCGRAMMNDSKMWESPAKCRRLGKLGHIVTLFG
jgi:hypothetical protein